MFYAALFASIAAAAVPAGPPDAGGPKCGEATFRFVGQPACVSLVFDGAHTQLKNDCSAPLLVDISVLAGSAGSPEIPSGGSAELRDLSAFTVGLGGEIHRAVAVIEPPSCPDTSPPPPVPDEPDSFLKVVLAVVLPG